MNDKLVRPGMCIPHLRDRMKRERDRNARIGIQIAINILEELPGERIEEFCACKDCAWYRPDRMKCTHKNGLSGKVSEDYYCPFASKEMRDEGEDERFEDFEED